MIRLLDLLYLISDSNKVIVYNLYDEIVSVYDGKNSIDEIYNNCIVTSIDGSGTSRISITIDDGNLSDTLEY